VTGFENTLVTVYERARTRLERVIMRGILIQIGLCVVMFVILLIGITVWGWPAGVIGLMAFWGPSIGLAVKKRREARGNERSDLH
jgi:hypothetical protein